MSNNWKDSMISTIFVLLLKFRFLDSLAVCLLVSYYQSTGALRGARVQKLDVLLLVCCCLTTRSLWGALVQKLLMSCFWFAVASLPDPSELPVFRNLMSCFWFAVASLPDPSELPGFRNSWCPASGLRRRSLCHNPGDSCMMDRRELSGRERTTRWKLNSTTENQWRWRFLMNLMVRCRHFP